MTTAAPERAIPLQDAAVLVPVYRDAEGSLRLVLVRRTEGGIHGGQIALPGGRRDETDATSADTALREAEEEIGLPRSSVELLATLPLFETRSTGFRIAPFLGRIVPPPAWRLDEREIAEVLEPRIDDLLAPGTHDEGWEQISGPGGADPHLLLPARGPPVVGSDVPHRPSAAAAHRRRRMDFIEAVSR